MLKYEHYTQVVKEQDFSTIKCQRHLAFNSSPIEAEKSRVVFCLFVCFERGWGRGVEKE